MTEKIDTYHHGNLRETLLTEGRKLLRETSLDSFSLREVARRSGVTAAAVYHHFPDKNDLLAALSAAGIKEFFTVLVQASRQSPDALASLESVCLAYINFFENQPELLDLLFSSSFREKENIHALQDEAFAWLAGLVKKAQETGTLVPGNPDILAATLWSAFHGFASLRKSGVFGNTSDEENCPVPFKTPPAELAKILISEVLNAFTKK